MEDIIIIGAGGVGKEVALLIEQINAYKPTWNIIGFIDDNIKIHNIEVNGYKVIGGINCIDEFENIYVVCAIANYHVKKKIINNIKNKKIKYANIIHPSVYIGKTSVLGEGVIIYPGVVMTTNIKIGNHVLISPKCGIGHEVIIGDYSSILWNVSISGNVEIGEGCFIGSGATIVQNIKIGIDTVIGAGAVVIRQLPGRCTAVGVPAKAIKFQTYAL